MKNTAWTNHLMVWGVSFMLPFLAKGQYSNTDTLAEYSYPDAVMLYYQSGTDPNKEALLISKVPDSTSNTISTNSALMEYQLNSKEVKLHNPEGDLVGEGKGILEEKNGSWNYFYSSAQIKAAKGQREAIEDPNAPPRTPVPGLWKEANWKDGYRFGDWKIYDEWGHLTEIQTWDLTFKGATVFLYHPNGRLKVQGKCNADYYQQGDWIYYDSLGNISHKEFFVPRGEKEFHRGYVHTTYLDSCIAWDQQQHILYHGNEKQLTWYTYDLDDGGSSILEKYHLQLAGRYTPRYYSPKERNLKYPISPLLPKTTTEEEELLFYTWKLPYRVRKHDSYSGGVLLATANYDQFGDRAGEQYIYGHSGNPLLKAKVEDAELEVQEFSDFGTLKSKLKFFKQGEGWKLTYCYFYDASGKEIGYDPYDSNANPELKYKLDRSAVWAWDWISGNKN